MNTFVSTEDTLQKPAGSAGCYFDWWNITIDPGTTEVTGTIGPPNSEVDFYIMTTNQYNLFKHQECGNGPYDAIVAVEGLTSAYPLDWKSPPPGWYHFIFSSPASGGNGYTITTPFVLVASFNQAETSTEFNVATNQVTQQNAETLTSVQVSQVSTLPSPAIDPTILMIAGVVVVAVVVALFFVRSRQGKGFKSVEAKTVDSTTRTPVSSKTFCLECGRELPLGSKFCNKCGTSQK